MRHSWVISYEKIDGERDLCKSVLLRNYPIYPYNVFNMLANYYLIRYVINRYDKRKSTLSPTKLLECHNENHFYVSVDFNIHNA